MNKPDHPTRPVDRRDFLAGLGALAAGAAAARAGEDAAVADPLPTIALGKHRVTRLVVGSNPINGYSYMGPHADRHMREYFTQERAAEFLLICQRAGINTHQFSTSNIDSSAAILRAARERGLAMHTICLAKKADEIKPVIEKTAPVAIVHHGGVTDRLFSEGKSGTVRDFVKAVRDRGLLAGVSAHNPDTIRRIADEGWENDFFMACLYFLTRKQVGTPEQRQRGADVLDLVYTFYRDDPQVMTKAIREIPKPCLAYKILAAGRMCASQEAVQAAFRFAFENIKPGDGVIVGMYPRFFDEIAANAQYTRKFGAVKG